MSAPVRTVWPAVLSGAAGAAALTTVHQAARGLTDHAPRMDALGRRAIARLASAARWPSPTGRRLQQAALVGDLLANTAYYTLVAASGRRNAVPAGLALGVAAGIGALVVPQPLGLGAPPHSEHRNNRVMTVAWYVLGGLVAGLVWNRLQRADASVRPDRRLTPEQATEYGRS